MGSAPGKIVLHRMGYYNDQAGIVRRYAREGAAWDPHLMACKRLIVRALSEVNPRSIAVLGAGSLLDLPLEDMVSHNRAVTLFDIMPPLPSVRETAQSGNITFAEEDITGGFIERAYRLTSRTFLKRRIDVSSLLDFHTWYPPEGTDMVISLNIMTQLAALPADYLRRKSHITADEERLIARTVQERHLEMLRNYDSVLITDFSESAVRPGETAAESQLLEVELPSGVIREQWDWLFDSHNRYNTGKITTFRVAGIICRR